jgi:hypothetical protein
MRFIFVLAIVSIACGDVATSNPDASCAKTWYADCDGDGVAGLGADKRFGCDAPTAPPACGGGWSDTMPIAGDSDCDDTNAAVHPEASEVCDMLDNNCDGAIDENGLSTFYQDYDGDGHGNAAVSMEACGKPPGYVMNSDDCNDLRLDVFPGAVETCDGIDNNCNLMIDDNVQTVYYRDVDGDGHGNPAVTLAACMPAAGYVASNDDCNDARADIYPGHAEVCDGADNNCNTAIDEGVQTTYYRDADGDGHGSASVTTAACSQTAGYVTSSDDCNDARADVYPGHAEACDGIDNNCNTTIDEGVQTTYYRDADGDGYGNPAQTTMACSLPVAYVANNTDCNDGASAVHPNTAELCFNNTDDDCSGAQDEAAECSIACNWSGARWLSHGHDGGNAVYAGAWVTCLNNKLNYMDMVVFNPPGWSTAVVPVAMGQTDNVVGCNWGNASRWISQGWDGGNAFTFGMDTLCSGGRVTNLTWGNDQATLAPIVTSGQLGCDWNGAIYLSHGIDGTCAYYTGMVVTCSNSHITNFQAIEGAGCSRQRD